jgi:hypothetical protein
MFFWQVIPGMLHIHVIKQLMGPEKWAGREEITLYVAGI